MITAETIADCRQALRVARGAAQTVGLVPTMGALHAGHLSLVAAAREECDVVVASVFVNPTQFERQQDLDRYPRDLASDLALLGEADCDIVFAPDVSDVYPDGDRTMVRVKGAATGFEGAHRPGHFDGVATIVLKLFHIVGGDRAYFGRKDYQQTLVVKQLVADFNIPIDVCVQPTMREADGLAMSSRNVQLNAAERRQATALSRALFAASDHVAHGERNGDSLRQAMRDELRAAEINNIDYIDVVREGTISSMQLIDGPAVGILAAQIGPTRLIDNHQLFSPPRLSP